MTKWCWKLMCYSLREGIRYYRHGTKCLAASEWLLWVQRIPGRPLNFNVLFPSVPRRLQLRCRGLLQLSHTWWPPNTEDAVWRLTPGWTLVKKNNLRNWLPSQGSCTTTTSFRILSWRSRNAGKPICTVMGRRWRWREGQEFDRHRCELVDKC